MTRERRKPEGGSASGSLRREGLPPCRYYYSTGSTLLDLAISGRHPGGVGSGRITQIYGDNSTAKTLMLQEILGSAQRAGALVVFEDAEHTLDFDRAERLFGLRTGAWGNPETQAEWLGKSIKDVLEAHAVADQTDGGVPPFVYRTPSYIEQLYDEEIGELLKRIATPVAVGVDSFSALPSQVELEANLADNTYGTSRAKMFSAAFRKYVHPMAERDLTVVGIDQTREKIGVAFGDKDAVSGGKAINFYASTRIKLAYTGKIKNRHDQAIGIRVKASIKKNKIWRPFCEAPIRILFDYGVDDIRANLEWLKEQKADGIRLTGAGAWLKWDGESLGQGTEDAIAAVEERGLEGELAAEVARVWHMLHESPERKEKER